MKRGTAVALYVVSCLMITMTFSSCRENEEASKLFTEVESVMEECPDSALALLDSAYEASQDYPRSQRMRYDLLLAEAKNKAYVPIDNDSVMREVVQYYDSYGTANERVHAHYLLGCSYRDMGESPQALNSLYDAIAASDTLSADCDWDLMMRVWGQIADVLNDQYMPMEYLEANQQYTKCAEKAHDEYEKIRGIELQVKAYSIMMDYEKVISITDTACKYYELLGLHSEAAKALSQKIACFIEHNKLSEADSLMSVFEKESNLFNSEGNIECGREGYYVLKGDYYFKRRDYLSAKTWYKKSLEYKDFPSAYLGLSKISNELHDADSALYYSARYSESLGKEVCVKNIESIQHTTKLYNYVRFEKIAQNKELEAERNKSIIIIIGLFVSIIALITYIIYRKHENNHSLELAKLNSNYINSVKLRKKLQKEMTQSEQSYEEYRKSREKEIEALTAKIKEQESILCKNHPKGWKENIKRSQIAILFNKKLNLIHKLPSPNNEEWEEMFIITSQFAPLLYSKIDETSTLTLLERQVTLLTSLGYSTSDIVILTDRTKQVVSNTKSKASKKLFNQESAKLFYDNLQLLAEGAL